MSEYTIRPLGPETWEAFADLAGRHNGGGFGCWCTWFHRETHGGPNARTEPTCAYNGHDAGQEAGGQEPDGSPLCRACPYSAAPACPAGEVVGAGRSPAMRCGLPGRAVKAALVSEGRAHAALVFDGSVAVGWCQYGPPAELPGIAHRKEYKAGLQQLPDYRLTCFFVDRKYRRKGVAAIALRGALDLIAKAGGGVVEAYPRDTSDGKKVSGTFLYNGTRTMFEQAGFGYDRAQGPHHCVMSTTVAPAG